MTTIQTITRRRWRIPADIALFTLGVTVAISLAAWTTGAVPELTAALSARLDAWLAGVA